MKAKKLTVLQQEKIVKYFPLCKRETNKFISLNYKYKNSYEDLLQASKLAVCVAMLHYNENVGVSFQVYAKFFIKEYLCYELKNLSVVTMPIWVYKLNGRIRKFAIEFKNKNSRYPTDLEVLYRFRSDAKPKTLTALQDVFRTFLYEKDIKLKGVLGSQENSYYASEIIDIVKTVLSDKPKRDRYVKFLTWRYLDGLTLQSIGDKEGISRQRAWQILKQAKAYINQAVTEY